MPARIRPARPDDRPTLEPFLARWHSLRVARRGTLEHPLDHPALLAEQGTELLGVLTYAIRDELELELQLELGRDE